MKFQSVLLSTQTSIATETPIYRKPWRVFVAVLLQRRPIISKMKTDIENRFQEFQDQLELEHSAMSDYEMRKIKVKKASQTTKKKPSEAEELKRIGFERELASLEDEEQSIQEELEKLQFADRLSPFDSDLSSLERKFDKSLHLAVRTTSDEWKLPEGEIIEGETLRQAAERIIKEHYQSDVQSLFLTNAPSGVHTIELTSAEKASGDTQGKKIFFYKAILQPQKENLPTTETDFKWLTVEEMKSTISPAYFAEIDRFAV